MSAKIKFFITLTIILLIIGGWLYFFYLPYRHVIETEREKISQIRGQVKRSMQIGQDLQEMKNRLASRKNELENQESKIINQSELDNIAQLLHQEMQNYDIKVINISPQITDFLKLNKDKKIEFSKLPIEVNIETKYLNFGRFLAHIYHLPKYIHPEAISMHRVNPKDNLLTITFTISVYVNTGI
jgi:Tfp pilus assembly protein PilO